MMQCSCVFQPSFCTPMAFHWPVPVRTLWPETRSIFILMENDILRQMEEMQRSMDFMDQVQQLIFKKIEAIDQGTKLFDAKPIPYKTEKEGNRFALTLDTKDFSSEELTVKQVGQKLRVTGKHEKKEEDGKGGYAFKYQEFRQEFELPQDVNPDEVTCSLSNGQLQIEAPCLALPALTERTVPINSSPAVKTHPERSTEEQEMTSSTEKEHQVKTQGV
ncbi:heat shock protein beta-11-like [Polyodon spathula]|uniref:heat shock protein beta-11-like n=1 Tax=Polyodon spathula TaxID=7913 RepID=UPI001B7EED8D|nr:heat shock protein beta-11-like [Polyodon spathula]